MEVKSLAKLIKSPDIDNLKNLIFIYGKEDFLKSQIVKVLKEKYKDINTLWGDETDLKYLLSFFSSSSLFSSKTIVILRNFESFIKNLKKDELKNFLNFCINIPQDDKLILISELDKLPSKEPYKTIKNCGDLFFATKLSEKAFLSSLKKKFISEGIQISDELIIYIGNLLKNDLFYTKNEVEKLILYAKDKKEITKEDIDKIINPKIEENIFSFLNLLFTKNPDTVKTLRNLFETGYHPFEIQSLILFQTNKLLLYKTFKNKKPEKTIFAELGLKFPFQIKQLKEQDKKVSKEELISLVKDLYSLEIKQKVYYQDIYKGLEDLVIKFLNG